MTIVLRANYGDEPKYKERLIRFLGQIFGLDLSSWDQRGFWDPRYRPFSFFDGDRLVSNVCLYSMDMMIQGRRCSVAQISGVGTLPEYRRQGLNRRLTEAAMAWAKPGHEFFFLFADDEAVAYYTKQGFRPLAESAVQLSMQATPNDSTLQKLDMNKPTHVELVARFARERAAVSDVLGVFNDKLLMFHGLHSLRDKLYAIGELEILIAFERRADQLTIYDVIGRDVPNWSVIYPHIATGRDETVKFLFVPDKLGIERPEYVLVEGNGAHVRGKLPALDAPWLFPFTAHA